MNIRRIVPVALVPLLVLAACGDDGDDTASGGTDAVAGTDAPAGTEAPAGTQAPEGTEAVETTTAATAATETTTAATDAAETTTAATDAAETTDAADTTTAATDAADTTTAATDAPDTTSDATDAADTTTAATTAATDAAETTTAATDAPDTTTAGTTGESTGTSTAGSDAPVEGSGEIVVGSADFPESELLAQIYGQALAEAGFDVSYQLGIGSREIYYGAIESGEVDLVPEYTNSLLSFVLRQDDPEATPEATNVDEQITALGEALPDGLQVLTPSTAEDKDVIVCTADAAEEFSLTTLSDLAGVLDQITLAAPPEFEGRSPFGLVGFAEILDAPAPEEFVPLDVSGVAEALTAGQVDCGNLFSTMSVITTEGFVALEDDGPLVPNEAVLPLVRTEVADEALTATLDEVNAALDTEALKALMVQVEVDAQAPEEVAAEWLADQG